MTRRIGTGPLAPLRRLGAALKKLPGKRKPPTLTLKRGKNSTP